jgi:RND superfamily putative drug exporter
MPESRTERRAYDLVADGFGRGANGPLVIAVDTAGDASVIEPLASAVAADPGIEAVGPPQVDPTSGVAALVAQPTTSPQDEATRDTIERLRSDVFPTVLAGHPASAHVGGQVATFADLGHRVEDRLPAFIAAVVTLSVVLLLVVFRSVLVPLKAAAMNLLSVGAAYGVLVMVFQWGWGADLIGLESTVPILSFIPLFMFAILFGLSMDYEVFLLSRIREEYVRTGDNDEAVVRGLASTGRTITSAALIMVAVFSGFILGEDPLIKMMGLGLATAIAVDATIVRLILVPATMKLLGEANWWLPAWLDRLLPGGRTGAPEPSRGDGQDGERPEGVRETVGSSSA